MRGERALTIGGAILAAGSSPHARGTLQEWAGIVFQVRFIPACAGNVQRPEELVLHVTVHPRMRGERRMKF